MLWHGLDVWHVALTESSTSDLDCTCSRHHASCRRLSWKKKKKIHKGTSKWFLIQNARAVQQLSFQTVHCSQLWPQTGWWHELCASPNTNRSHSGAATCHAGSKKQKEKKKTTEIHWTSGNITSWYHSMGRPAECVEYIRKSRVAEPSIQSPFGVSFYEWNIDDLKGNVTTVVKSPDQRSPTAFSTQFPKC